MSVHIGSLGVERPQVDATFDWFGETIRVHPDISDLAMVEFMDLANTVEVDPKTGMPTNAEDEKRAVRVVSDMLRGQVHPDDFDRFMSTARRHRQQLMDLMAVSHRLVEAASGFPTGQRSDSSSGPPDDTETLPVALPNRAARRSTEGRAMAQRALSARELRDMQVAADATAARPDLQVVVQQRYQETFAGGASA